jgi:4-amino-4-deoxy-L-arabinose transferase-like glycosyltransferase
MSLTIDRVSIEEDRGQYPGHPSVEKKSKFNIKRSITWENGALSTILALSGFLGLWNLSINGYSNDFYAAAVRSMIQSWHNFFYLAYDPGAWVTVDKPPLAFMVQAVFAKVFGYSGVTLLLPEALAGILGVYLLYYMVKRAFGPAAGLLSALMLAVTPIFAVMNRDNNPDSLLVLALILSAWAALRAAELGKVRWLLLSGVFVGLAFNIKMLEAWIIIPAIYGMYFLFARTKWWKRILHLALAGVVIVVVSFSWAVVVDLTPANQRPYIDGSTDNTVMNLIFGYNGLGRVDGNERGTQAGFNLGDIFGGNSNQQAQAGNATGQDGFAREGSTGTTGNLDGRRGATDGTTGTGYTNTNTGAPGQPSGAPGQFQPPQNQGGFGGNQTGGGGGGGGGMFGGEAGITRLLTPMMGAEFNWYFPLALLGIVFLTATTWFGMAKGLEKSRRMQSVAMWGGWFLVFGLVLSMSKGIIHTYYMNVMAPAGAALAGTAIVMLWQTYKKGGWLAWLLPVGIVAAALYQAYLLSNFTSWNWWLGPVILVVGAVAFIGLALGLVFRNQPFSHKFSLGVVSVATAALLVTPTWWSIQAVFTGITGSIPSAVPNGGGMGGGRETQTLSFPQTWTNFVASHLGGQLLVVGIALVIGAALVGLWFLFKHKKWFNLPIASGIILALFLVGSAGWWVNVAQAQTTQNSNRNGGFGGGMGGEGGSVNSALLNYLTANQDGYKNILAVSSSNEASSTIAATGLPIMSLGGFSGSDQTVTTTAQVETLVNNKIVRFFMVGGGMGGGRGGSSAVSSYVQSQCTVVNSSEYSSSSTSTGSTSSGGFGNRGGGSGGLSGTLYKCGS